MRDVTLYVTKEKLHQPTSVNCCFCLSPVLFIDLIFCRVIGMKPYHEDPEECAVRFRHHKHRLMDDFELEEDDALIAVMFPVRPPDMPRHSSVWVNGPPAEISL